MDDETRLRYALVDELKKNNWLTDVRVEEAFRAVPRHLFLPNVPLEEVYSDRAIPTKMRDGLAISSSSQPAIMAVMLEQLALRRNQRVLEIGAGTGYNAALMARLVGEKGQVATVDVDEDIVERARESLERANVANVEVVCADGGLGYLPDAPYDAIIATVGVWDLSPHWVEQLREGGQLVAPLWFNARQFSIAFEKTNGRLTSQSIKPCGFMRLRGAFAGPEGFLRLDDLILSAEDAERLDTGLLRKLFSLSPQQVELAELQSQNYRGLVDFIALKGEPLISIFDQHKQNWGCMVVWALVEGFSLTLLTTVNDDGGGLAPNVLVYGDGGSLHRLKQLTAEWIARGRPNLENAKIIAVPLSSVSDDQSEFVIRKRWMEYRIYF